MAKKDESDISDDFIKAMFTSGKKDESDISDNFAKDTSVKNTSTKSEQEPDSYDSFVKSIPKQEPGSYDSFVRSVPEKGDSVICDPPKTSNLEKDKSDISDNFIQSISQKKEQNNAPSQRETLQQNRSNTQEFHVQQGNTFGRFQIIEEIGRGGMGQVHKAYDPKYQRIVALKLLLHADAATKEIQRFSREAKATAKLQHPNIVSVYEIGEKQESPFFVMEYINGKPLSHFMKKSRLSIPEYINIMIKIAQAVHYAHTQGVIHRDLKPSNIMMDANMEPKVMDFGLARVADVSQNLSKSGMVVGTLKYMPPEQAKGRRNLIDQRSDVYTLGIILYEILTGNPPFSGHNSFSLVYQIVDEEPKLPTSIKKRIPKALENICLKALEKKRNRRYQSAMDFAEDLQRFVRGENIFARSVGVPGRLLRKAERHKFMAASLFLATLLFVSSLVFYLTKNQAPQKVKEETGKKAKEEIAENYCSLGKEYLAKGDRQQAIKNFTKSIKLYKHPKYFDNRGLAYAIFGKLDKAITDFDKAIALDAKYANAYLNRAIVYHKKNVFAKALKDFDKAIALDTKSSRKYVQRGLAYMQMQKFKRALLDIKKAIELSPHEKIFYKYLGDVYHKQGQTKQALYCYREYLKKLPSDGKAKQYVLAYIQKYSPQKPKLAKETREKLTQYRIQLLQQTKVGNYQKALAICNKMMQFAPNSTDGYNASCAVLMKLGQPQQALQNINKAIEIDPSNPDTHYNLGSIKFTLKDFQGALKSYTKTIQLLPTRYDAYLYRAQAYENLGEVQKAYNDYTQALKIKPDYGFGYLGRAHFLYTYRKYKESLNDLFQAQKFLPASAKILRRIANCYTSLQKYQQALAYYKKALEVNPKDITTYVNRGSTFLAMKKFQQALKDCNHVIAMEPRYAVGYVNRGKVFVSMKKYPQAVADFRRYLQMAPNAKDARQIHTYINKYK